MIRERSQLFERRSEGGQEVELVPTSLYVGGTVPAGATRAFSVSAQPGLHGEPLYAIKESSILARVLGVPAMQLVIRDMLGFPASADLWFLVETLRQRLLPSVPLGKPGDFDLIVGKTRGGYIAFDELGEIEFKIRKTDANGVAKDARLGIDQGRGAAECGFDRTVLVHLLVREPGPAPENVAGWYDLVHNASESRRALNGNVALMRDKCREVEPFGYAAVSLGQGIGGDPSVSGALQPVTVWPAALRPLLISPVTRARRREISDSLRQHLGDRRPASPS